MKEQLIFIELLFKDLLKNAKIHVAIKENYETQRRKYVDGQLSHHPHNTNDMNKNHGKVALKRKITFLRQELLNLERMLDK